jgi:hypothetical protein
MGRERRVFMRRAKLLAVGAALVVLALAAGNQGQVGQAQQEVRTLSGHTCCVLSAQFGTGSTSTAKGHKSPLAPQLPQTLIVDDTVLQLGSRRIWLFLATDPERKMIVYAEPYAGRSQWDCGRFLPEDPPALREVASAAGDSDRSWAMVSNGLGGATGPGAHQDEGIRNYQPLHPASEAIGELCRLPS